MTSASSVTCEGCRHVYVATALFCPNCGRAKVREEASDALLGKVLGERFLVQALLGQGASGTIYRAEHVTLRRKVGIKVLHAELSRDDLAVERFRREATTVAEIDNEHIVEIHDFGRTPDGRLYLAMELLDGETLDTVLARDHTLSVEKTADILIQVGEALMEAHAIGYVHRDLRPRNVYLANRRGKPNFVKLLDFGLAKLVETDAQAASTSLGMTFGDPRYMSPEQARGDRIDRRADIYQLGCVAYEMLTGTPPFVGTRVFDILTKQVTATPTPLPSRRPGVPLWMEASVARMLAKNPDDRFATTTRMVEALRRGLETGEVMDDVVARKRETVPPPSVSRAMARLGVTVDEAGVPSLPAVAPPVSAPAPAAPVASALPQAVVVEPAPPAPTEPLPRKRTGTPKVGVPVVAPSASTSSAAASTSKAAASSAQVDPHLPAVSGQVIDDSPMAVAGTIDPPKPEKSAGASAVQETRTVGPTEEPGISQGWYDNGELDDAATDSRVRAKPRQVSTGSLDVFDEDAPPRRRWGLIFGVLGVLVVGAGIAFALAGSGKHADKPADLGSAEPIAAGVTIDAAPSVFIADAAVAVAAIAPDAAVAVTPAAHTPPRAAHGNVGSPDDFVPGGYDPASHRPGGATNPPNPPNPINVTPPNPINVTPPLPPLPMTSGGTTTPVKPGVSGTDGPVDPYNPGGSTPTAGDPTADGTSADRKAEFYANLGTQQLGSGDVAGAAANFKKATELDPKNATAAIGMGDIALHQGLFGDAITHLRKAAKLAPKNAKVFTLLGEAYLNSGQNDQAAQNFKRALQLDPDNARARDGYNEASSRVPAPTDDQ